MADTIQLTSSVITTLGSYSEPIQPPTLTITLSARGASAGIQDIGTAAENVDMGDVATADQGWCFLYNLDSTNYIEWGYNDAATIKKIGKLAAGDWAIFRLAASQQLMAQANTATCKLQYKIWRA